MIHHSSLHCPMPSATHHHYHHQHHPNRHCCTHTDYLGSPPHGDDEESQPVRRVGSPHALLSPVRTRFHPCPSVSSVIQHDGEKSPEWLEGCSGNTKPTLPPALPRPLLPGTGARIDAVSEAGGPGWTREKASGRCAGVGSHYEYSTGLWHLAGLISQSLAQSHTSY